MVHPDHHAQRAPVEAPDKGRFSEFRARVRKVIGAMLRSELVLPVLRVRLLRILGAHIDSRTRIEANVRINKPSRLSMGAYCFINFDCLLDSLGGLTIGDRVSLAPGVSLITTSHAIGGPEMRCGEIYWAPIIIGDGVWIGANATVLPGISVGPGAVIAAGAVVTADIEPNGLYAGVPARRTAELNNTESADLGTI